jgi:hypothetical protein
VGLEINVEKTKSTLLSHHHNAGKNQDIKTVNRPFVSQLKYFGTTVRNQNLIQKEIKRMLISDNTCYHSVHNLLSLRLLSKNVKIKIHTATILPVVLYGYEIPFSTLRKEHRLRVFENRVLRRIVVRKRVEVMGGCGKLHTSMLRKLYSLRSMIRTIKSRRIKWDWHVARMEEKMIAYRLLVGKPESRSRWEDQDRERSVGNTKMELGQMGWEC